MLAERSVVLKRMNAKGKRFDRFPFFVPETEKQKEKAGIGGKDGGEEGENEEDGEKKEQMNGKGEKKNGKEGKKTGNSGKKGGKGERKTEKGEGRRKEKRTGKRKENGAMGNRRKTQVERNPKAPFGIYTEKSTPVKIIRSG